MAIFGIGEGGGKGAIAYHIDYEFPRVPGQPDKSRRVWHDCKGREFGQKHTWETPGGTWKNGDPVASVTGFGLLGSIGSEKIGVMVDWRTVEMLQGNCCPPELLAEVLGADGGAD